MADSFDPVAGPGPVSAICRILVIRPNHRLGNNVLLTPLLAELEHFFPGAEIEVLTGGNAAREIFAGFRRVVAVHAFPSRSWTEPRGVLAVLKRIRNTRYDLAIDASIRSRSGRSLLAQVQSKIRIGYAWESNVRNRCLTHVVAHPTNPEHMALSAARLVRAALGPHLPSPPTSDEMLLDLKLSSGERAYGRELISRVLSETASARSGRTIVSVYPYATGAKNYSEDWWRSVASGIKALSENIRLVEIVPGDGRARLKGMVPILYSTRIRELAAAIGETDLLISGDGGVMHLGAASGARVLGLFKVTDPAVYAPYGRGSEGLVASDTETDKVVQRVAELLRSR